MNPSEENEKLLKALGVDDDEVPESWERQLRELLYNHGEANYICGANRLHSDDADFRYLCHKSVNIREEIVQYVKQLLTSKPS